MSKPPVEPTDQAPEPRTNVFGRHGSPTISIALPFSRLEVREEHAGSVAALAELVARLAEAGSDDERAVVAAQARVLADALRPR